MPKLNINHVIKGNSEDLFAFVANVDNYKDFLPWCSNSRVIKVISEKEFLADLTVKFGIFEYTYTSLVEIDPENKQIKSRSTHTPFKYLESKWSFVDQNDGCKVYFEIDFEINIPILKNKLEKVFLNTSQKILEAFENKFYSTKS